MSSKPAPGARNSAHRDCESRVAPDRGSRNLRGGSDYRNRYIGLDHAWWPFGVTPGLGSVTALAVLVPVTYYMSPLPAIAFLVGVNKGGTSGGAVPAILLNAPGTPEAAASALDGYPMARRGEAERAMKFALYSSVTGDTISDLLLIDCDGPLKGAHRAREPSDPGEMSVEITPRKARDRDEKTPSMSGNHQKMVQGRR